MQGAYLEGYYGNPLEKYWLPKTRRVSLRMERGSGFLCLGVRINVFWKWPMCEVKGRKELNIMPMSVP